MGRPGGIEKAIASLLGSRGETDAPLRRAVFDRVRLGTGETPKGLAPLVEKIADQPWAVTDEDILQARQAGYSEDQLFELILAAAAGAGVRRLDAGVRVLDEAQ